MQEMGALIVQAARLNAEAIPLLEQGRHSRGAARRAGRGNDAQVEGRADGLHEAGLKDLFHRHGKSDAMAFMIGSEIYGELEKVSTASRTSPMKSAAS